MTTHGPVTGGQPYAPPLERERAAAPACYEPFDPAYLRSLAEHVLDPISESYFRPRLVNGERIRDRGPLILAANHSGNALPYDGIILDLLLWHHDGLEPAKKFRTVFEAELAHAWWMRPFGIDNLWRRGGGVDMTFDNFERLLLRGDRVLYFPEGVPGIGKGFQHRYELRPFHTSFVLLAARHEIPMHPLYIVNAEWVMPFHFTFPPLDWVMQRFFHVPFLPLPLGVLAMLIPWMWYLTLPARMVFVVGEGIDVRALCRAEGVTDFERPARADLLRVAEVLRQRMQRELDAQVAEHGAHPYDVRSLLRELALARRRRRLLRVTPPGWPLAFLGHERDRARPPARSRLHAIARDLDLLAFYLPGGWPLLSLARRLRRPPYGHRGLRPDEERELEGTFTWRLAERPLPPRGAAR